MTRVRVLLGITIAVVTALVGVTAASAANPSACANRNNNTHEKLQECVTLAGVRDHQAALQDIADDNAGTRAAGLPGYLASVQYAESVFAAAGYTVTRQTFQFTYTEENSELVRVSPNQRTFINESEFLRNRFDSGVPEGTATGPLVNVDLVLNPSGPPNTSTSGCDAADWAGFPAGAVALVQRGTCGFTVKVLNAQAAGASAVIVMNEGQPGRTGLVGMIGDATGLTIPAVFATFDAGLNLATTASSIVTVKVDFTAETRDAYNVLAESKTGNANNVVMVGAHLDSVQAGPGINDNGSGSAAILEVAEQMAKVKPTNNVRFALWGAEESGLLGSRHYVTNLAQADQDKIALYLNFDMIGSPNYMFGIYDGDNSGGTAAPGFIPAGSAQIEDAFERFYTGRSQPFNDTEFSGRSDYGPFIAVGIPAGGLFTGAEGVKTAAQAAAYGGTAGTAYDPCYHQACDTFANVNTFALDVNSDAVAYVTLQYGMTTRDVNGVPGNPDFEVFLP
ncbi:MAG TPA: M20/M25/M40 family metallo-hydrolase [Trueperaceae bacterium]|nr:M20/M25/M40 family metallo-hydrolase [Trueperaceae bacterium]